MKDHRNGGIGASPELRAMLERTAVKRIEHTCFSRRSVIIEGGWKPAVVAEARKIEAANPNARRLYAMFDLVTLDYRINLEIPS